MDESERNEWHLKMVANLLRLTQLYDGLEQDAPAIREISAPIIRDQPCSDRRPFIQTEPVVAGF